MIYYVDFPLSNCTNINYKWNNYYTIETATWLIKSIGSVEQKENGVSQKMLYISDRIINDL